MPYRDPNTDAIFIGSSYVQDGVSHGWDGSDTIKAEGTCVVAPQLRRMEGASQRWPKEPCSGGHQPYASRQMANWTKSSTTMSGWYSESSVGRL